MKKSYNVSNPSNLQIYSTLSRYLVSDFDEHQPLGQSKLPQEVSVSNIFFRYCIFLLRSPTLYHTNVIIYLHPYP